MGYTVSQCSTTTANCLLEFAACVINLFFGCVVRPLLYHLANICTVRITGETMDGDAMVVVVDYREDGTTPFATFIEAGLEEEKV